MRLDVDLADALAERAVHCGNAALPPVALLLNADIRGRRFFRIAFLMPFMLSPVAVSWMVGKSLMETRFGPIASLFRWLGVDNPAFFSSPWIARLSIETMDAWVWIPFIVILMLAGLQAMPRDIAEAAEVDGANGWQKFWKITFPLMLPISTGPFYAVEIRPAIVGMTFTGIRADHEARVLDAAGRPIPGLFAAGELTGGQQAKVYFGGGTSIGNAVAFGRIAGRNAAAG